MAQARLRQPRNFDEADAMASEMLANKRNRREITVLHAPTISDIEKLLQKTRNRRDRSLKRLEVRYKRMEELIKRFGSKHRAELIPEPDSRKTLDFPSGSGKMRFRNQEDKFVPDADEVVVAQRLLDMGETEFAYLKPTLKREALELLANRSRVLALAARAGFHFEPQPEKIYVDIEDAED